MNTFKVKESNWAVGFLNKGCFNYKEHRQQKKKVCISFPEFANAYTWSVVAFLLFISNGDLENSPRHYISALNQS